VKIILIFNKLGRWWNNREEIDIVAFDNGGSDIVFAECKFQSKPVDTDVFYALLQKKEQVLWNNKNRCEKFVLFSISGFTDRLIKLANDQEQLMLISEPADI